MMFLTKNQPNFRQAVEVKSHVKNKIINRQKYEFPVFTGKIAHAHTVCIRPFLLPSKGLGTRLVTICINPWSVTVRGHIIIL